MFKLDEELNILFKNIINKFKIFYFPVIIKFYIFKI